MLFRIVGWRYSSLRGAWVFAPFKGRFGPVLRCSDDPLAGLASPDPSAHRLPAANLDDGWREGPIAPVVALAARPSLVLAEAPADPALDGTRWPFLSPGSGSTPPQAIEADRSSSAPYRLSPRFSAPTRGAGAPDRAPRRSAAHPAPLPPGAPRSG